MINIKWLYVLSAIASLCGYGAGVFVSPSQADVDKALRAQAEEIAAMDCAKEGHSWQRVDPKNSPGKEF